MTKEEILLKVMSMLKNNQVEFLMELSEIKNILIISSNSRCFGILFPIYSKALS